MGKLIAIDGVDASGKQTHTQMLYDKLLADGIRVKRVSFPAYDSPSSALVKMYLSGQFGENPEEITAYTASTFFAADRFASFKTDWEKDYDDGAVIIADRYVSSNMIHQASKIDDDEEKDRFLEWLFDFEYNIYKIPKPDITFFLDMPTEYARELMRERENKFDGTQKKDIHERNEEYLKKSYKNACGVSKKFSWEHILCVKDGQIRNIEEINNEMYEIIRKNIL